MPDFVWRAATASGQITEGRITSASAALALKQLRSQGLAPISLDDQALGGALVDSVAACQFSYTPGTNTRGGLVTLRLALQKQNERIVLLQQVHVDNAP